MKVIALVFELASMFCVTYGATLIHPAAGWIVGGTFLALAAYALENQD